MDAIDSFLSRITTYRLARNGLGFLALISIAGAFFGLLPYTALQLTLSLVLLLVVSRLANSVCALFVKAVPTPESAYITGLVLFFILSPLQSAHDGLVIALIASLAILSKYLIASYRRHIFNPAAVGVFLAGLWASGYVVWWIAAPLLLPFTVVVGLLIVRKMRRFDLFCAFGVVVVLLLFLQHSYGAILDALVFFGTVLLMDPQTMPTSRNQRIMYGVIVGLLYAIPFKIGALAFSPALALLMGNLFAYVVSFRKRHTFEFHQAVPLTRDIYEFTFLPRMPFSFTPGHFMEWSLAHKSVDGKGNRRQLALASAPEDPFVRVLMQVPVEGGSFERALRDLPKGTLVTATNMGGELVLPIDPDLKIAIIAEGTGIAPFMSSFRHLFQQHKQRDMVLIYTAQSPLDLAYQDEIDSLKESIGLSVLYLPRDFTELSSWKGKSGYITPAIVREMDRDFRDRSWYVSGPIEVIKDNKRLLRSLGVSNASIKQQEI